MAHTVRTAAASAALLQYGFDEDVTAHLFSRAHGVRSFSADLSQVGTYARHSAGIHAIPVHQIQGSVGRDRELRADFMPILKPHGDDRYRSVVQALENGMPLPPIEVYRLGARYYVIDGHHRVAAALRIGMLEIDAEVTEFQPVGVMVQARAAA